MAWNTCESINAIIYLFCRREEELNKLCDVDLVVLIDIGTGKGELCLLFGEVLVLGHSFNHLVRRDVAIIVRIKVVELFLDLRPWMIQQVKCHYITLQSTLWG